MLPRIRFPSFSGHYTEKSLHDAVLELKSGLSRMFSDSDIGLPVIRSNNIKDYCLDFNELKYWFEKDTQGATTSNYHLRDGDILVNFINSQAQIGKSAIYYNALNRDCIYTTNILSLRINKEYSPEFIFFFFQTKKYDEYIQSITKPAVNQASFTTKDFRKMKIFFPDLTEQTKIANFLCSVDEKIALLNKQYELLCQYKKGMMQKIFSQEVRFKDEYGEEFPEWEESLLSERIKVQGGFAFKSQLFSEMASTKVLRIGDISEEIDLSAFSGVFSTETPAIRYQVNKGDFVMALSGATFGKMGLIKCGNAFLNQRVATFRLLDNTTDTLSFYYYYMSTMEFINYIKSIPTASAQPNISNKDIELYSSYIPTQKEQTKIANFLSALDDKIAVKKAELGKLKTWKQGLLQQMFV